MSTDKDMCMNMVLKCCVSGSVGGEGVLGEREMVWERENGMSGGTTVRLVEIFE